MTLPRIDMLAHTEHGLNGDFIPGLVGTRVRCIYHCEGFSGKDGEHFTLPTDSRIDMAMARRDLIGRVSGLERGATVMLNFGPGEKYDLALLTSAQRAMGIARMAELIAAAKQTRPDLAFTWWCVQPRYAEFLDFYTVHGYDVLPDNPARGVALATKRLTDADWRTAKPLVCCVSARYFSPGNPIDGTRMSPEHFAAAAEPALAVGVPLMVWDNTRTVEERDALSRQIGIEPPPASSYPNDPSICWLIGCGNPGHPRGLPPEWDAPGAAAWLIGLMELMIALRRPTPAAPLGIAVHMPHGYSKAEEGDLYTPQCWTKLNRHAKAELHLVRAWRAAHPEVRIFVYTGLDPAGNVGEWLPWLEQAGVDGFIVDMGEHRHLVKYRANLDANAAETGDDLSEILIGGEPIALLNGRGDAGAEPSQFVHDGPAPELADRRFFYVMVGQYYRKFVNEPVNGPLRLPAGARVHLWQENSGYAAEAAAAGRAGCVAGWSGHIAPVAENGDA